MAIPEWGYAAGLAFSGKNLLGSGANFRRVGSNEQICAF
jgi:hypothetical protein